MKHHPLIFNDETYDGQVARAMYKAYAEMADLGEVMATAHAIGRPDADTWYEQWFASGERAAELAHAATGAATKRSAYLRASEYYRQAYFFLRHDLDDPRLTRAYEQHVASFEAARPLLDVSVDPVRVPVEGGELKGFFYASAGRGETAEGPRPLVLLPCGYDSTAEEGHVFAMLAVEQGFSALSFEGPGQGEALLRYRMFFRPDFEQILTPWVDAALARDDVDPAELVLVGRSFAGYLAPRAAAFEHRLAALVCDPAQPNMAAHLPEGLAGRIAAPVVNVQRKLSPEREEFFGARMATHGVATIEEYFDALRAMNMLDVAGQITCPTLAVECEGDPVGGGGASLVEAMTAPAQVLELSAEAGAGGHIGGLGQLVWRDRVYPWIREVLETPAA